AALERNSEHPLAAAIVRGAAERGVDLTALPEATGFVSITGKGVHGRVGEHRVAVGNRALLEDEDGELGVDMSKDAHWRALADEAERLRADGQTVMLVAVDGAAAGLLGV